MHCLTVWCTASVLHVALVFFDYIYKAADNYGIAHGSSGKNTIKASS